MKNQALENKLISAFTHSIKTDKNIKNAFLLIHNDTLNTHLDLNYGEHSYPNQQYYIASIGKVFTSVMIGKLCEEKRLSYDDQVMDILGSDIVDGLHTFKGINYAPKITVRQLLNHTSGIGDYFEDTPIKGKSMLDQILESPYTHHHPIDIINWVKDNIKPRFKPDTGFHYSDTGYHLLGLIIEKIVKKPLYQVMQSYIFKPLHMEKTYLMSQEKNPQFQIEDICDVYWDDQNVKDYSIFKDDFAGGGIVTTSSDLLMFFQAVINHQIISKSTLDEMTKWSKHSSLKMIGIQYGLGLMYLKPIPFLFPKKYSSFGHIGSIGSFMFYNPFSKTFLIGSVNRFRYHPKSMRIMFNALKDVIRIYEGQTIK